jgi:hypothetical protein
MDKMFVGTKKSNVLAKKGRKATLPTLLCEVVIMAGGLEPAQGPPKLWSK